MRDDGAYEHSFHLAILVARPLLNTSYPFLEETQTMVRRNPHHASVELRLIVGTDPFDQMIFEDTLVKLVE